MGEIKSDNEHRGGHGGGGEQRPKNCWALPAGGRREAPLQNRVFRPIWDLRSLPGSVRKHSDPVRGGFCRVRKGKKSVQSRKRGGKQEAMWEKKK